MAKRTATEAEEPTNGEGGSAAKRRRVEVCASCEGCRILLHRVLADGIGLAMWWMWWREKISR
jgi:hypothetical protein